MVRIAPVALPRAPTLQLCLTPIYANDRITESVAPLPIGLSLGWRGEEAVPGPRQPQATPGNHGKEQART